MPLPRRRTRPAVCPWDARPEPARRRCAPRTSIDHLYLTDELGGAARRGAGHGLRRSSWGSCLSRRWRGSASSGELCAAARRAGAERGARPVARGRRRGRSLPVIRVDLDRTTSIRRLPEAQGVDGISFTVHPLDGELNTIRPWLRPVSAIDASHAVLASAASSPGP